MFVDTMKFPDFGPITLLGNESGICQLHFGPQGTLQSSHNDLQHASNFFTDAFSQLTEYFARQRKRFSLKLSWQGSAFQTKVLQTLTDIPYGQTESYQGLAIRANSPKAQRAVGRIMNTNPLPIFLPCHRVIGKDGRLVGFGPGLALKEA